MFGNKEDKLVGASAKLAAVERMKASTRTDLHESADGQSYSQAVPVTFVFALAVVLVLIMDAGFVNTSGFRLTGIPGVDRLIFGGGAGLRLAGDPDLDKVITMLVRGLTIFAITGIVPVMGRIISRIGARGRVSPLVAAWAALLLVPILVFALGDLVKGFF